MSQDYQDHCNANYGPEDILDRQRAVIDGKPSDLETRIAKDLWHRFGNPSVEEWENETHKADYIDAAVSVIFLCHRASRMDT